MDPNTNNSQNQAPIAVPVPNQSASRPSRQPSPPAKPNKKSNKNKKGAAKQTNPNSTQNELDIAEIRDGIVIMNDGTFRSVVMVKATNFDLMSPEEKESIEFGFQGFLNALYFPVQIYIHSERVDISVYLDRLDKIRSEQDNMLLALLMDDYINFMYTLSEQTNIMNKDFYIITPYNPVDELQQAITQSKNFFSGIVNIFNAKENHVIINEDTLNQAKDELRNRAQDILGGLTQCGIQGLPLDTEELIELFYNTYNPDTAVREKLKDFEELNAPIITKGKGMAPQPNLDNETGA